MISILLFNCSAEQSIVEISSSSSENTETEDSLQNGMSENTVSSNRSSASSDEQDDHMTSSSSDIESDQSSVSSSVSVAESSSDDQVSVSSSEFSNAFDPFDDKLGNISRTCNSLPPKLTSGESGWNSRYWDCCKPHCSGSGNTEYLSQNCSVENEEMEAYRVIEEEWHSWNKSVESGCVADGEAFTCYSQAPYAICDNLAYGYAAVPGDSTSCGTCYQLDFDGGFQHGEPKAAHALMKGKTMIVMASNIGYDVADGQFDLMIPGGGVGAYDGGCAVQWDVDVENEPLVGKKYGGFISTCQEIYGYDADVDTYKECVRDMCNSLFGSDPGMQDLWEGCLWFVDWMHTADNPTFTFREVECPQELVMGYESTFH
ncbi:MAG: hypothetical protein OCD76_18890 [Reichenbachiella sp.]